MNLHWRRSLAQTLTPTRQALAGLAIAALLALPASRHLLEASMWRHMVLQYPLWMLAGALLTAALPERAQNGIARWNASGISGLILAGTALLVLMIPRVLDLALLHPPTEFAKSAALLATGSALRLSWRRAGLVVQGFFLGNMLLMGVAIGQLYANSPLRLCNAYLLDDQVRLGNWLTGLFTVLAVAWLVQVAWWIMRREADTQAMAGSAPHSSTHRAAP